MGKRETELLAPGGSFEAIRLAVAAGADAVYVGGSQFGARAYAKNLSGEELKEALDYVHLHGAGMHLTVNTLLKERELAGELYGFLAPLYEAGLDAVIVQDLGVLSFIRREFPSLPVHASTQMTVAGVDGAKYLEQLGVSRVILARELSLEEIGRICRDTQVEIECFVHGALCVCYSGQCLMSSMLGGRSGNRGRCAQPCRLAYQAEEGQRAVGKGKPSYMLSPRDICLADYLPELIEAGVYSFKIEGRMKRAEYAAGVTGIYRKYMDMALQARREGKGRESRRISAEDRSFLERLYTRSGFSDGYLFQQNGPDMMADRRPDYAAADEAFFGEIRRRFQEGGRQREICGRLKLSKGQPAVLEMELEAQKGGRLAVTVSGDIVQEAKTRPLDRDTVSRQMDRTKDTPFAFGKLEIYLDPDAFLPVQALNRLRREGIAALEDEVCRSFRRRKPYPDGEDKPEAGRSLRRDSDSDIPLRCLVRTREQLEAALESPCTEAVYVEASLLAGAGRQMAGACRAAGKRCYLAMPYVFRERAARYMEREFPRLEEAGIDGVLARSLDALGFLRERGFQGEILADYTLYGMNREAQALLARDASWQCAPLELNLRELKTLDLSGSDLVVYGYIPLMVTAQCLWKNGKRECLGPEAGGHTGLFLRDRYGKRFRTVQECAWCYNLIYNSLPLNLQDQGKEIRSLRCGAARLQFVGESRREASRLLEVFGRSLAQQGSAGRPEGEFTRGHFFRGIE